MRSSPETDSVDAPLGVYDIGSTPFYALQWDRRLSYCLYVPESHATHRDRRYPLVVLVHGTDRGAAHFRDAFADFAETHQVIVLAPLFPCNMAFVGDTENYKLLRAKDLRYDLALLEMVEEVRARYRVASERFLLHGFSGGGHFVHRFLYVHPDRLLAASIGAPGVVTLCDPTLAFPLGLAGFAAFLGDAPKPERLAGLPVHCVVGAEDVDTWEILVEEGEVYWMPGINDTGATRIARLKTLAASLEAAGCDLRFEVIEGVDHDEDGLFGAVQRYFAGILVRGVALRDG